MRLADRPQAVLFDLFDTLVPGGSRDERDRVSHDMAAELGVDPRALAALVRSTFDARTRGQWGDLRQTVARLAAELGGTPDREAIDRAVDHRLGMTRALLSRTWAIPALATLRDSGVRIGLVSDCSGETPAVWPTTTLATYIEAVSFSCVTGARKPEAVAYRVASDALGVAPERCLFVGDGGSGELTGAAALGMTPVRFIPRGRGLGETIDRDSTWTGPTVTDLAELVPRLGGRPGPDASRSPG